MKNSNSFESAEFFNARCLFVGLLEILLSLRHKPVLTFSVLKSHFEGLFINNVIGCYLVTMITVIEKRLNR